MKKFVIAVIAIFILLGGTLFYLSKKYTYVTFAECSGEPRKAAELLLEKHLEQSRSPKVPEPGRIEDYEIVKVGTEDARLGLNIELTWDKGKDFEYFVEYNVQTTVQNSHWVAGNGEPGDDNWINDKEGFISFHKVLFYYVYDSIGTGP